MLKTLSCIVQHEVSGSADKNTEVYSLLYNDFKLEC